MTKLSEKSSMKENTDEVESLTKQIADIENNYMRAAQLDPEHVKLKSERYTAYYYMRLKGFANER